MRPWWLVALIPILIALLNLRRLRDAQNRWEGIIAPHLLDRLLVQGSQNRKITPLSLSFVFAGISIVALAGPSWRQQASPFFKDEAPLVIALDLSETMLQEDVQPSRLDRAKQKIHDLLSIRGASPTGLIVFSGTAHTVIPLTDDPEIIDNLLTAVTPQIMPTSGKRTEKILPLVQLVLEDSKAKGTVLLMTDAFDESASNAFVRYFAQAGHQLLVWGIGSESKTESPAKTRNPLQVESLRSLAKACNGSYIGLSIDKRDTRYALRKTKSYLVAAEDEFSPWVDEGYYLIMPMVALIALWFRKGWTLSWE